MNKNIAVLKDRRPAEYVIAHTRWQKSRGRQPSEPFGEEKNPRKALALALQVMEFVWIRRSVPAIHVFEMPNARHKGGEITILTPREQDDRYERRYGMNYTEGNGSRENPYTYLSAAPVSPHYVIIDLWYQFRNQVRNQQPTFIEVNGWLLEISLNGVTALDGHFTRLADPSSRTA